MSDHVPEPWSTSPPSEVTGTALRKLIDRKGLRFSLIGGAAAFVVLVAAVFIWLISVGVFDITDEQLQKITQYQPSDNTVVYDRNGTKIGEFFSHYYVYVPYEKMPKKMINAILAIEDRNFFKHSGIDVRAIFRAFFARLFGNSNQGGSTITQQVVRHFLLSQERTFERKAKEAALALRLESILSKEKIIEIYTNAMFLGNGAYGVGAAANRYFGRPIHDLKDHEIALIAGLFQSPSAYNPVKYPDRAKKRQLKVIAAMHRARYITKRQALEMREKKLDYRFYNSVNLQMAPYFIDYVQELSQKILKDVDVKNSGLRIFTTLDAKLQEQLNQTVVDMEPILKKAEKLVYKTGPKDKTQQVEMAMLVTQPESGEILGMTGGRDYQKSQFNRTVSAKRQPGSLFKPAVYSLALQRGWKWSDQMYVAPVSVDNYRPKNYGDYNLTETTALRAFYLSINTPTVEIGQKLGLSSVLEQAKKLGIRSKLKKETGTMLGGSEVTMLDLAAMYGTFANGGFRVSPYAIVRIENRKGEVLYEAKQLDKRKTPVLSNQIAYLMQQGLRSVFYYGTAAQSAEMGQVAAGKTGTTNDSRDNWFAGFTPNLLAITWVGADEGESFHVGATGTSLALPIWTHFMKKATSVNKPPPFPEPPGIVSIKVNSRYGNRDENGIPMYFIEGQEPVREESNLKQISNKGSYRSIFD